MKLLRRLLELLRIRKCDHNFVMDDFVWFREECTKCGKRQRWSS